ncbi:MAG TPA: MBL fold metallo-hydrolase [Candidatus Limiplasma sp.]|nr:MBL fold metallo-hydrolase [Candidatus Limiplasma sp.]HRX08883.1 MBL fold metallo-hydrolase [Candidatus Limiplasma sp.]
MIVKVLMEDTCPNHGFLFEHGLSLYIEASGYKILFDTGQSSAFIRNAETLGVDLAQVDFAVLSHAHYDHSGGISSFLQFNDHAKVYVSQYAFDDIRHGPDKYIGPDKALKTHPHLVPVTGNMRLADGISVYSGEGNPPVQPVRSFGLTMQRDGELLPDDFRHEQYLEIIDGGRRVLISGCSHKGIQNIVHWFKPDILIGGLHLYNLDPQGDGRADLDNVARDLAETGATFYTCHCTGVPQYEYLKQAMRDQLFYISSGQEITV